MTNITQLENVLTNRLNYPVYISTNTIESTTIVRIYVSSNVQHPDKEQIDNVFTKLCNLLHKSGLSFLELDFRNQYELEQGITMLREDIEPLLGYLYINKEI